MNALVIDDSQAMRRILTGILTPLGFTVTEAADGQQGLDAFEEMKEAEVILVDWNMPVMDGLEFVKTLRANPACAGQNICMVTSETEPDRMVRALMAGVDEFVMKPFTADILVEKLKLIGVRIPSETKAVDAV